MFWAVGAVLVALGIAALVWVDQKVSGGPVIRVEVADDDPPVASCLSPWPRKV